ncbi:MAG: DNA polymerase ligase N-terminal domain-containing protein [Candidatus Woesearchaeota archaeon]
MKKLIYSIQKHLATHLHYDLRLQKGEILKSWAIPKKPPTEIGEKRLAVEVEDHPLDYAFWEGEIPKGHYGAGKVELWDRGFYELIEEEKNKIIIKIEGEKLKGEYVLLKMSGKEKDNKNWLFFKKS